MGLLKFYSDWREGRGKRKIKAVSIEYQISLHQRHIHAPCQRNLLLEPSSLISQMYSSYLSKGRKLRGTKEPLDEGERGE